MSDAIGENTGRITVSLLITIDGPAGAGKTTVSRLLAAQLGYRYLDTGALYRSVAYCLHADGIDYENVEMLTTSLNHLDLVITADQNAFRILWKQHDITDRIRTPEITMMASLVSAKPSVRSYLLYIQRDMGKNKSLVCEGRDMGTVVFPEADVKFYLDADPHVRALRRCQESPPEASIRLEDIARDMHRRDQNDSQRTLAPLKVAEDAVRIDCTHLDPQAVVCQMMQHIALKHRSIQPL